MGLTPSGASQPPSLYSAGKIVKISNKYIADPPPLVFPQIEYTGNNTHAVYLYTLILACETSQEMTNEPSKQYFFFYFLHVIQ